MSVDHELYLAWLMSLDQGDCLYVRRDLAEHPGAHAHLREVFGRAAASSAQQGSTAGP
jgi:hypothetical protein